MDDSKKIERALNTFTDDFKSCIISTLTHKKVPFTSYAPFVKYNNDYYIIISKIARHYENMKSEPNASIMFIEDEQSAQHIFFRKRLSYQVEMKLNINSKSVIQKFQNAFGNVIEQLLKLDFMIVKCIIKEGYMILGPGKAYHIDENQKLAEHIKPDKGHQRNKSDA